MLIIKLVYTIITQNGITLRLQDGTHLNQMADSISQLIIKLRVQELMNKLVKSINKIKLTRNFTAQKYPVLALVVEQDGFKDSRHLVQDPIGLQVILVTLIFVGIEKILLCHLNNHVKTQWTM